MEGIRDFDMYTYCTCQNYRNVQFITVVRGAHDGIDGSGAHRMCTGEGSEFEIFR